MVAACYYTENWERPFLREAWEMVIKGFDVRGIERNGEIKYSIPNVKYYHEVKSEISTGHEIVLLCPSESCRQGAVELSEFRHPPRNVVYWFGRDFENEHEPTPNLSRVYVDQYRVINPQFWASQIAAVVFYHRLQQLKIK